MITITKDKLIIEIEHPVPGELLNEFKEAIVYSLQHVDYSETSDLKELGHCNYFMLELLKSISEKVVI